MGRAQLWYIELVIAIIIVSASAAIFLQYILREPANLQYTEIAMQAIRASESIMSAGHPEDWDAATVKYIGITNGEWRVENQKLETFYAMPDSRVRIILGLTSNYQIALYNQSTLVPINGKSYVGQAIGNTSKIASVNRYLIVNSSIMEMRVTVWE